MMTPQGGSRRPAASMLIALALIITLAVVVIVAALTEFQLPDAVTVQGKRIDRLYQVVLGISFFIYFAVTAGIIWAVFRYRRRDAALPEQIHGSSRLEVAWTAIPAVILIGLFVPSLILVIDLKTPPASADVESGEALEIDVVGQQWLWTFTYPKDGITVSATAPDVPKMVVPIGQTVLLKVRSVDVVHSFYAPNLLYKIQAVPGTVNDMHFKIEKAGSYTGQCYQFCGLKHSDMRFVIEAVEPAEYERWLGDQKKSQATGTEQQGLVAGIGR